MAQMRRLTVAGQLAVLVLIGVLVAPCKSSEEAAEGSELSNSLSKRKTSYTIQVEGVIYCKCNLTGYFKAVDAAPLPDAVAVLRCNTTTRRLYITKTDAKGYFLVKATLANKYLARYCKVHVSSPLPQCTVPRQYRLGDGGAKLIYERNLTQGKTTVYLYTSGFLQLGPAKSSLCHL